MPLLPSFLPYSRQQESDDVHERQEAAQLAPPPPICLTGVMCTESTLSVKRTLDDDSTVCFTMRYLIFRPRSLHSTDNPPLVVLHGGPNVPSNYLLPLVHVVTDRALVFYDQLGCGRSSRPTQEQVYSISNCINDLQALLQKLELKKFHLYGQSFGGILGFEYLKSIGSHRNVDVDKDVVDENDKAVNENDKDDASSCLSLIMSSTPTSIALVEAESKRILMDIMSKEPDLEERQVLEKFRQEHECRVVPIPLPLLDAYAQAGSVWKGTQAIPDYVATCAGQTFPPTLVLRGQHDFVTPSCTQEWKSIIGELEEMVLAGCSHHALLENEQLYGDVIHSFLSRHDNENPPQVGDEQENVVFTSDDDESSSSTQDEVSSNDEDEASVTHDETEPIPDEKKEPTQDQQS